MIIRIIQRTGLESAIARFDAWWNARSPRERILFSVMAVLIGGVVLLYGIVMPLQNARAKAFADIRTYETLNARIRAAGTLQPRGAQPQARVGRPDQAIIASGAAFGVTPAVEPTASGMRATVADAPYDSVMSWLADVGATTKLKVSRVSLKRQAAPGRVSATVEFTR